MKKIIVLSGKQGSGKTTLATALQLKYSNAVSVAFADPIYELHNAVWDIMKEYGEEMDGPKDGTLLQMIGDWGRKRHEEIWVRLAQHRVENLLADDKLVIITDCRLKKEFFAFPSALSVRLECSRDTRQARCTKWRDNEVHITEVDLDEIADQQKFDLYLRTDFDSVDYCIGEIEKHLG